MTYYLINGFNILPYVAEDGIKWSRNDVDGDNAGRVLNLAKMQRDRLAIKMRHDFTLRELTTQELRQIYRAIEPVFVTVQYDGSATSDTAVTRVMYSNNMSGTLAEVYDEETDLHKNITFPLIEQ